MEDSIFPITPRDSQETKRLEMISPMTPRSTEKESSEPTLINIWLIWRKSPKKTSPNNSANGKRTSLRLKLNPSKNFTPKSTPRSERVQYTLKRLSPKTLKEIIKNTELSDKTPYKERKESKRNSKLLLPKRPLNNDLIILNL